MGILAECHIGVDVVCREPQQRNLEQRNAPDRQYMGQGLDVDNLQVLG